MPPDALAWTAGLTALGLVIGSFLATMVVRWPEGRSVRAGRSVCDGCGRALRPVELVPLASYLVQRGRCRDCGAPIDPIHPRVELACATVGALSGIVAPGIAGLAGAVFGWLLVALAAIDWRHFWLPDRLVLPLALAGVAVGTAGLQPALADRAVGGVAGFALLFAVATTYRAVRGREGMGGGDPKLFGAIGLWLGWRPLPAVLVVAGLIGLGIVAFRAATGRRMAADAPLPLGTLLAVAAYPAWWMVVASAR